jgi:fermentation-respiration switch protein FrsA (DUF1100 family)
MGMSWRVRVSVLLAILWVAFGNMALAAFSGLGIWFSLLTAVFFAVAAVGIWRDRYGLSPVGMRRFWAMWLVALVWTILMTIARAIPASEVEVGLPLLAYSMFSGNAEGLEIVMRDITLAGAALLLVWSGLELVAATYRYRASSSGNSVS